MAPRTRIIETIEPEIIEPGEFTYEKSDEEVAFDSFKEGFASDSMGTIRVQRIPESKTIKNKGATKGIYLFSCSVDHFTFDSLLEFLRDNYGGGTYRVMGTTPNKSGTSFNKLIEIESPNQGAGHPFLNTEGGQLPNTNSGDQVGLLVDKMGQFMMESQQRTEDMLSRVSNPNGPGQSPMEMMQGMVTMLATLGVVGNNQPNVMDEIVKIKEIAGLIGIGNEGGGDSNFYSMMTETIKSFGPAFAGAIAQGVDTGAINPTPPPVQPKPAAIAPPVDPNAIEPTEKEKLMKARAQYESTIRVLVGNAGAGTAPETMAQTILDMTPDDKLEELLQFIGGENCIDEMAKTNPDVLNHREWFDGLRMAILSEIIDESDQVGESLDPEFLQETQRTRTSSMKLQSPITPPIVETPEIVTPVPALDSLPLVETPPDIVTDDPSDSTSNT